MYDDDMSDHYEDYPASTTREIIRDWAERGMSRCDQCCACRGGGWIGTPLDTWEKCRFHDGPHPEYELYDPEWEAEAVQYMAEPQAVEPGTTTDDDDIPF